MAAVSTEKWIKFFARAGIPPRAAATYALTFSDNRIQRDMLLDLNKEYLRDMGITLMGDVIAILRHARQVHEELTHEKLLSSSKNPNNPAKVIMKEGLVSAASEKQVKNSKVIKVLSRRSSSSSSYSSSSSSESSSTPSPPKKMTVPSRISDPNLRPSIARAPGAVLPLASHSYKLSSEKTALKRMDIQTESLKRKSTEISRPKPSEVKVDVEEVPVKKVRRVLPEHEGGYKIKMPTGSTPRTQQILAKQKELAGKKTTVFDRLGGSNSPGTDPSSGTVSSTTSDPTFTVTGIENQKRVKISSVFSRLGDKQASSLPASASTTDDKVPLPGILKATVTKPVQRTATVVQNSSSMVADSLTSSNRNDIQSRVGTFKEATVVKRSATFVTIPKQDQGLKRSATVVSVPRPMMGLRKAVTISASPTSKIVKTEGILGGQSSTVSKPIKSRLGAEEKSRPLQAARHVQRTIVPLKKKVEVFRTNGSAPSNTNKKVTFSGSQSNVFSRLGR